MSNLRALSDRVIFKIIQKLSINQKFECRKLNRKFKRLIDALNYDELIIITRLHPNGHWFRTKKPLSYASTFRVANFDRFFENNWALEKFKNIQRLKICSCPSLGEILYLDNLNFFRNLKQLELVNLNLKSNQTFRSENLELLMIEITLFNLLTCFNIANPFVINAPKLRSFIFYNFIDFFKFIHPESIQFIYCFGWLLNSNWTLFINLETLVSFIFNSVDENFFKNLKNLREIQFLNGQFLSELDSKRSAASRTDVSIQYLGIDCRLMDSRPKFDYLNPNFDLINEIDEKILEFYVTNHKLSASSIYGINNLNINETVQIMRSIKQKSNSVLNDFDEFKFLSKLVDIQTINIVDSPIWSNHTNFLIFLQKLRRLQTLNFENLTEHYHLSFFENLSNQIKTIRNIKMTSNNQLIRNKYAKILKMFKDLISITIDEKIDHQNLTIIYRNNRFLQNFIFLRSTDFFKIIQLLPSSFFLIEGTRIKSKNIYSNLEQVLDHFDLID